MKKTVYLFLLFIVFCFPEISYWEGFNEESTTKEWQNIINRKRKLESFNYDEVEEEIFLEAKTDWIYTKFCNNIEYKNYSFSWGYILTNEYSTGFWIQCENENLMLYEQYFNLSWASYFLDWNTLLIATTLWDRYSYTTEDEITIKETVKLLPSPATENCEKDWWTVEYKEANWISTWICTLPDWSKCEEWEYYRWACKTTKQKLHWILDSYFKKKKNRYPNFESKQKKLDELISTFTVLEEENPSEKTYTIIKNALTSYLLKITLND